MDLALKGRPWQRRLEAAVQHEPPALPLNDGPFRRTYVCSYATCAEP